MKNILILVLISTLGLAAKNCNTNPRNTGDYHKTVACSLDQRNKLEQKKINLLETQNELLKQLVIQVAKIADKKD